MRISDGLRAAKALAVERNTRGALARTASGKSTGPRDSAACSFCAIGAVRRVTEGDYTLAEALEGVLYQTPTVKSHNNGISIVNDNGGVPQVEQMFNEAIAIAERREGVTCA